MSFFMLVLKFLILSILPVEFLAAEIANKPVPSNVEDVIAKIDHPISEVPASSDGIQDDWKKQQCTINAKRRLPPDRFKNIERLHDFQCKLNKEESSKSIAEEWLDEKLLPKSKDCLVLWKFSNNKSQLMIDGEMRTWDTKDHIYDWIGDSVDADELLRNIDEFNKSIEDLPKKKASILEKLQIMNPLQYIGIFEMRNPTFIKLNTSALSFLESILPRSVFVSVTAQIFWLFVFQVPVAFFLSIVDCIFLVPKIIYYAATSDLWIIDATEIKPPEM